MKSKHNSKKLRGNSRAGTRLKIRRSAYLFAAGAGLWLPQPHAEVLVDLDATNLPEGALPTWANTGSEPGDFVAPENGVPSVTTVQDIKGVTFDGTNHYYTGPAASPFVVGGGARTIEAWILNPVAADEETIVSWGRRGDPAGSNMSFNHGVHGTWGATGHWGEPDFSWNGRVVQDRWTYVVYTYDGTTARVYSDGVQANSEDVFLDTWVYDNTPEGLPLPYRIASQNELDGTATAGLRGSMTIAKLRVHNEALDPATIEETFYDEMVSLGLDADADKIPRHIEDQYDFLDPNNAADASADEDGDGLTNFQEYRGGTMLAGADSDGDGLSDGAEVNRMHNGSAAATDPLSADTDGDGLSDAAETATGNYVSETDTGTDPLLADTDADTFNDAQEIALGSDPNDAQSIPGAERPPVVSLTSSDLTEGPLTAWESDGLINGSFVAPEGGAPVVETVAGVKAVSFNGTSQYLTGPAVPSYLTGNSSRTVEAWIRNPSAADEETIFAWGRRSDPPGSNTSFNHGLNATFGAVGHWGATHDVGWGAPENVKQGPWTHVAYSYDSTTQGVSLYVDGVLVNSVTLGAPLGTQANDTTGNPLPFRVASQNNDNGTATAGLRGSLSIAEINVYDRVLEPTTIEEHFTEGADDFGAIDYDADGLPTWYEREHGFDENSAADATQDADSDGLTNLDEFIAGTDPRDTDTDDDGLSDQGELNHPAGATNPLDPDSDNDTLLDGVETGTGTFVDESNTGTNPLAVDSDFDAYSDQQELLHGSNPNLAESVPAFSVDNPLVYLDALDLPEGPLTVWPNEGLLGGQFTAPEQSAGVVDTRNGTKGVTLDGVDDSYVGPIAPTFVTGDAIRSVDAWVFNPDINTEESVIAWGRRGGNPDGSNASYTHGTHADWGALGQWGPPDVGFGTAELVDGTWTHLAYAYDGAESRVYENGVLVNTEAMSGLAIFAVDNQNRPLPFRVGAQSNADGTVGGQLGSLTIGRVRAYDHALTTEQVQGLYQAERDLFVDPVASVDIESATFNEETRQMTITWSTAGGAAVNVEATEDFENWETVATGVTTGEYTETVPASGHRFYRLSMGN